MTVQTVPTFRRMAVQGPACRIKGSEASLHFYQTFVRSQLGISRDLRLRRLYSRDRCRGGARSPFLSPCSVPGSEGCGTWVWPDATSSSELSTPCVKPQRKAWLRHDQATCVMGQTWGYQTIPQKAFSDHGTQRFLPDCISPFSVEFFFV